MYFLNWNKQRSIAENWPGDFHKFAVYQKLIVLYESRLGCGLQKVPQEKGMRWVLNTSVYHANQPGAF